MKRSISTSAAIPVRIPMSIPARTSVGKWTYKYSLEKAIRAARIRAGIPQRRLWRKMMTAAVNPATECPDGNEKSLGILINISISSLIQQGRGRAINFFNPTDQRRNPPASPAIIFIPQRRRGFHKRNRIASRIQNKPASPRKVIFGMSQSNHGVRIFCCIQSRI